MICSRSPREDRERQNKRYAPSSSMSASRRSTSVVAPSGAAAKERFTKASASAYDAATSRVSGNNSRASSKNNASMAGSGNVETYFSMGGVDGDEGEDYMMEEDDTAAYDEEEEEGDAVEDFGEGSDVVADDGRSRMSSGGKSGKSSGTEGFYNPAPKSSSGGLSFSSIDDAKGAYNKAFGGGRM